MRGLLLPLLLLLALAACAPQQDFEPNAETAARIERVENGLIPAVLVEGQPRWNLSERMEHYGVPGVSVAVIENFEVVWARGYGVMDTQTGQPVTDTTLFQAASISKTLNATAVMKHVERGHLELEAPANDYLQSWRIPENEFTRESPVTVANLLSHTGGTTMSGFPGYATGAPLPTVQQILRGEAPANTDPVIVDIAPGSRYRYSGGGTTILQLMMIELEQKPYPQFMKELVLDPAGMTNSSFAQPLPPALAATAASAHDRQGNPIEGKWHVYPELAAAGLWTTSADLCRFAIEHQLSLQSRSNRILSEETTRRMITPYVGDRYGLGFGVREKDGETYFTHNGGNWGFSCTLIAHERAGYGAAVMVNANGMALIDEIIRSIALEYGWANYIAGPYEKFAAPADSLAACAGRYRQGPDQVVRVIVAGDQLRAELPGERSVELIPISNREFVRLDEDIHIGFPRGGEAHATALEVIGQDIVLPRMPDDEIVPFEMLENGRIEEGKAGYRELHAGGGEATVESRLNLLGYELLGAGNIDAAIALFALNTEFYPGSANTYDSLGEAYLGSGDLEHAQANYEKTLELAPGNANALAMLERIRTERDKD